MFVSAADDEETTDGWEEEDEVDPEVGDGGGVVLQGCSVDKTDKTIIKTQPSNAKEPSSFHGRVEAPSLSVTGGKSAETKADTRVANNILAESHLVAQTIQASSPLTSVSSEENPKINNISQGKLGIGGDVSSSTLKSETISKKAFALQDKIDLVLLLYLTIVPSLLNKFPTSGNTVPILFLRATDISPIALLSNNVVGAMQRDDSGTVAVEALQELFTGDGQFSCIIGVLQMPFPPSVYQWLTSSSTLLEQMVKRHSYKSFSVQKF
ncbi:hypothetical protein EZV62_017957 [Acer yangbiense]|uniref:Uncharacterized protein n=1 Tax=Acer yangbiense TaxID=1000413 RepID=A0A5C7HIG4_9ROSI|nr:hypothetical protein EZV62_017957 [Acer yangbiense]